MNELKKLVSILVAMLMLIVVAAGCGQSATPSTSTTASDAAATTAATVSTAASTAPPTEKVDLKGYEVKFSMWWDGDPRSDANKASVTRDDDIKVINDLEQKYNCKIKFVNVTLGEYAQKWTTSVMAGDALSDMAIFATANAFPRLYASGACLALDDYIDYSSKAWEPRVEKYCLFEGKHYAVASAGQLDIPSEGIYFNKKIFERDGLPNPYELVKNKQWTWEKFREIAKLATKDTNGDGKIDQWGLRGQTGPDAIMSGSVVTSNGASWTKEVNGKVVFSLDEPAALEALQFDWDLVNVDKVVDLGPPNAAGDYWDQEWLSGKIAMNCNQFWLAQSYRDGMKDDQWGWVPVPMGPKATDYVNFNSDMTVTLIPSSEKYPKQIATVLADYYSPKPWRKWDWRTYFEGYCFDKESVDICLQMKNWTVPSDVQSYDKIYGADDIFYSLPSKFLRGKLSAKAWVESVKDMAQKNIDDTWTIAKSK